MERPPRRSGLGGLVMHELASRVQPPPQRQARRVKACPRLKTCREKARGHVPDSEKVYYQKKERAAKALAALSLSWAPHAGVAMGLHPHCPEAKEVAGIKAQEWASVEARTLWQAKAAWESWAGFAKARGYMDTCNAPSSLITLWMNSNGTSSGAQSLYRGLH